MSDPANTPADSSAQPTSFDPIAAGREIDRLHDAMEAAFKRSDELGEQIPAVRAKIDAAQVELRQVIEGQNEAQGEGFDAREQLTARLVEAKANVPNFKKFVAEHTHISRSTAYRLLDEANGRIEEVRQATRERVARHRANKVSVTDDVTDTNDAGSNVVALDDYRATDQLADVPLDPITDDELHKTAQKQADKTGREGVVVRGEDAVFKVVPACTTGDPERDHDEGDPPEKIWRDQLAYRTGEALRMAEESYDDLGNLKEPPTITPEMCNAVRQAKHAWEQLSYRLDGIAFIRDDDNGTDEE